MRKFATLDEMPEQILLVPDNYKAEVTAGDSVAASFTEFLFQGDERVYNFKRDGYFGISSVWHSQYSSQSGSV